MKIEVSSHALARVGDGAVEVPHAREEAGERRRLPDHRGPVAERPRDAMRHRVHIAIVEGRRRRVKPGSGVARVVLKLYWPTVLRLKNVSRSSRKLSPMRR